MDANKLGRVGYESGSWESLYAILMVWLDFQESLNIVTDSQYAERVVLCIETVDFI